MSDNTRGRQQLEKIYGKGCMFKKAKVEEQLQNCKRKIKSYKRYVRETHYTLNKIRTLEQHMTYHHLKHRSERRKNRYK